MNESKNSKRSKLLDIILLILVLAGITGFVLYWLLSPSFENAGVPEEPEEDIITILSGEGEEEASVPNDTYSDLVVTNLDVGKADCAVLQYQDTTGIIDTGTEEKYNTIDSFLSDNAIDSIDYMILTHYDQDHIGSAVKLLQKYPVDTIYIPDYESEKRYYPGLMEELEHHDNVITVGTDPVDFQYDNLNVRLLPAEDPDPLLADQSNRDNNMSLVSMVDFGENKLLFTGDIEADRITQIVNSGDDLDADWIKLPHHGSYEKEIQALLEMVTPEDSVISTSSKEKPDKKLLKKLDEYGIHSYDTMDGNVVTICDGTNLVVEGQ